MLVRWENTSGGGWPDDRKWCHFWGHVIVSLSETIRIMGEIDEVIEEHGGWPGAFQSEPSEESPSGKAN